MSKKLNLTMLSLLSLCIIPVAGIVGVRLFGEKISVTWESLGSPPESPTRFVAGKVGEYPGGETYNGRETTIYVETSSGKIYRCCSNGNTSWLETTKNDVIERNWAKECLRDKEDENRKHLDKEIDNYAVYWCGEFDYGQ